MERKFRDWKLHFEEGQPKRTEQTKRLLEETCQFGIVLRFESCWICVCMDVVFAGWAIRACTKDEQFFERIPVCIGLMLCRW